MADEHKTQEEALMNGEAPLTTDETISSQETTSSKESDDDKTNEKEKLLTYNISSKPPIHLTILLAVQQCFIALPWTLTLVLLICEVLCAMEEEEFIAQLLMTAILLSGLCTLLQVTFGVRLPVFQGPTTPYVIPLLAISELPDWQCPARLVATDNLTTYDSYNSTGTMLTHNVTNQNGVLSENYKDVVVIPRVQLLKGSLMLAGGIHMLVGMTGSLGILLKFIGPITVIPTILLVGLNSYKIVANFCAVHWGISAPTAIIGFLLSLHLGQWEMPLLVWNRKLGFHTIRFPLQQVLALLISLVAGWILSLILTVTGSISDDKNGKHYYARTDARLDIVYQMPWFYAPHPWQFEGIGFSVGIFAAFLVATFVSIIDSVADYYAVARTARVPPPPLHSINRGIMAEGFMSFVAGIYGAGHATTTYGDNIGVVAITKVASRRVFQCLAAILIMMSFIGKLAAVFINIPIPVLGATQIVGFGAFLGLVLSNLQFININSSRNLTIIGIAVLLGLVIPFWMKENSGDISTGDPKADKLVQMLLTNPNLIGGVVACVLDNTVPGTLKDRGMIAWTKLGEEDSQLSGDYEEGMEVYEIRAVTKFCRKFDWLSYIPFMPTFTPEKKICRRPNCCKRSKDVDLDIDIA